MSFMAASVGEASRRVAVGIRDIRPARGTPDVRYFTGFDIGPEPTRYRISLDELSCSSAEREIDIGHVSDLVISDSHNEVGVEVLIGDVRLEGGRQVGRASGRAPTRFFWGATGAEGHADR